MKRALVAVLIPLYPSRWRAEYGDELAALLLDRPLALRAVINVAANAVWQQFRMGEPWLIVGGPLVVWGFAAWTVFLLFPHAPAFGPPLNWLIGLLMSIAVGFWTSRRSQSGGRGVLKLMLLLHAPVFVVGLLTLVGAVHAISIQGGFHLRLAGPGPGETEYPDAFGRIVSNNLQSICIATLIGSIAGFVGRVARRRI